MDYKRKLFNFRPLLALASVFIVGILLSSLSLRYSNNIVLFALAVFLTILLIATVIAIYYKKKVYYITLILSILLVVFSVFSVFNLKAEYQNENFNGITSFNGEIVEIKAFKEGEVDNYYRVVARGEINGKVNKVIFDVDTTYNLYLGNKVGFVAEISKISYFDSDGKINYNTLINKEYYRANYIKDFSYFDENASVISSLKRSILIKLKKYMPENYGFSYALLTGDTAYVDSNVLSGFNYSGISHVFAVSGLHVGFLYLLISRLLKFLKVKVKINRIITVIVLFLYVYFCGFTSSCMRAFVILTAISLLEIIGAKGDRLSAVGLSAIINLFINPFRLYGVGFILSYVTYLSLILLTKPIEGGLSKIFPNKVAKVLAPSTSAFVGATPIVLNYFGYTSAFAMLFNLIIVPIIGFVFIFNFIAALGILISDYLAFLCVIPNIVLTALTWFINSINYLAFIIRGVTFGKLIILYYLILILYLREINLPLKTKKIAQNLGWFIFILSFIVINIRNLS